MCLGNRETIAVYPQQFTSLSGFEVKSGNNNTRPQAPTKYFLKEKIYIMKHMNLMRFLVPETSKHGRRFISLAGQNDCVFSNRSTFTVDSGNHKVTCLNCQKLS